MSGPAPAPRSRTPDEDLYSLAKQKANQEAADEYACKGLQLLGEDRDRAVRLVIKAAVLWPQKYGEVAARLNAGLGPDGSSHTQHPGPSGSGSGRPPPAWGGGPERAGAGPQHGAGQPQSTAPPGGSSGRAYSEAWPPPPPPPQPGPGPSQQQQQQQQEEDWRRQEGFGAEGPGVTAADNWVFHRLDKIFKRLAQGAAVYGSAASTAVHLLHHLVTFLVTLLLVTTVLCSSIVPWVLGFISPSSSRKLNAAIQGSYLLMLACGLPTAVVVFSFTCRVWFLVAVPIGGLKRLVVLLISSVLWEPSMVSEIGLSAALLIGAGKQRPLLFKWWPAPIMMYISGAHVWCLSSLACFLLLLSISSASLQSAIAVSLAMRCLQTLEWYKAMPAMLLLVVGWIVSVVERSDDEDKARSRRSQGSSSSSGSSSGQNAGAGGGSAGGGGGTGGGSWWGSSRSKASAKHPVPKGATGEVARVLRSQSLYEVLDLQRGCDDEAVRRAKRTKSLATHPDKLHGAAGAKEAFQRVTEAVDVLSDALKRREYDRQLRMEEEEATRRSMPRAAPCPPPAAAAAAASGGGRRAQGAPPPHAPGPAGGGAGPQAPGYSMELPCQACGRSHTAPATDIDPARARSCKRCNRFHAAKHGDAWIERPPGFWTAKRVLVCLHGVVMDITRYAECNDMMYDSHGVEVEPNTCKVPLRFTVSQAKDKDAAGAAAGSSKSTKAEPRKKNQRT